MSGTVKESNQVSGYFTWFLVHAVQTGIGILNYQQKIVHGAEQDAWVSVLFVGVCMHLVVWMMFRLLRMADGGDILSLHRQLFGPIAGTCASGLLFVYCVLFCAGQIRQYGEILHVWVFPDAPLWQSALIIFAVAGYIVSGGFRVITGICLVCVLIPSLILPTLYFPLQYAHWLNLLPLWNHRLEDYAQSAIHSINLYLGPEFLLFFYPFIKNNTKAQKWAHLAVFHSTVIYMVILVGTFVYFNMQQLRHTVWPSLILSKIIRYTIVERFDYIYIFNWLFVIFPGCCISIWAGARILNQTLKLPKKWALWVTLLVMIVAVLWVRSPVRIERLENIIMLFGGTLTFAYIPLLLVIASAVQAVKRRRTARSD
ncbi:MAG: GerAB/ArcD/ProY family transporter [Paenibacillus sp.]|uniref:GerAB/ArcD/ProY family transporter n=1 Tax=Paenibacillus sp. TaxID=58172 RepID=UPI00290E8F09|nr:GerAB/ArcD/ProY family transporter [Paenibacillus sp.]MDU4694323.1 GerAB/ArcD/ProY family transporter [Paenibacillus sp.]